MARIRLVNVTKRYSRVVAVDNVSFDVSDGEFFVLLGPSGCGKTTTLRLIAGLEIPDEGEIWIDDREVSKIHPKDRDVAMVFQNYALYPHMSVYENIAFPLKIKKKKLNMTEEDIRRKVVEVAKLLGIEELLDRKPAQLSGGQQQRVALARSLVRNPKVWLLDEPLSNLDAKLRVYMRAELKKLQKDVKITTVYVTHDQVEAMSMADRIAVMNKGKILQLGDPDTLYKKPQDVFVATFLGSPPTNIVECHVEEGTVKCPGFSIKLEPVVRDEIYRNLKGDKILVGIRPEHITVYGKMSAPDQVPVKVAVFEKLGTNQILHLTLPESDVTIKAIAGPDLAVSLGEQLYMQIDYRRILYFDPNTEKLII